MDLLFNVMILLAARAKSLFLMSTANAAAAVQISFPQAGKHFVILLTFTADVYST